MKKLQIQKTTYKNISIVAILVLIYILIEILLGNGMITNKLENLLIPCCYYAILAMSLNLTVGILGELSLGHAGFMCVAAFTSGIFSRHTEETIQNEYVRFGLSLLVGVGVAAIFGFLIGISVLKLKGDYLAIVTLAFGEIIKNIIQVMYIGYDSKGFHISLKDAEAIGLEEDGEMYLKGALGIRKIPRDSTFLIAMILVIITFLIIMGLINSRTGRAIRAIRDNRIAAEATGINVTKYKLIAFTISAALAGVGGVLYAHKLGSMQATASTFGYNVSIMILVFVVLGGIGNISGSIIAAVILTLLPEYLRDFQNYRMLIYSIVLIVLMIFKWNPTCKAFISRISPKVLFKKMFGKYKQEENVPAYVTEETKNQEVE